MASRRIFRLRLEETSQYVGYPQLLCSRGETSPRCEKLNSYDNVKIHRTRTEDLGRRKQRKLTCETWIFIIQGL